MYKMIRILPMSKKIEFKNTVSIQDFFLNDLRLREDGEYCYKKQGIRANEGSTLILFQYDNKIVASADLVKIEKFNKIENGYKGALYFNPKSIRVFDELNNEEINNIFNTSIKFGQTKYYLDTSYQKRFFSYIKLLS